MGNNMDPRDAFGFSPVGAHTQDTTIDSATTLYTGSTDTTAATKLLVQAITQNVRMTLDGTAPTTTKGFRLVAGDPAVMVPLSKNTVVKVISETAGAAVEYCFGE